MKHFSMYPGVRTSPRIFLLRRALFWRRAMYVDLRENEMMFYRMSKVSYHKFRKQLREWRKEQTDE